MIYTSNNFKPTPTQLSSTIISSDFPIIPDRDFKDFFLGLPLIADTPCYLMNGEYEQHDQVGEFVFKGQPFEFRLKQGKYRLDDGREVKLPLPNSLDNEIKNIILNSLERYIKIGARYEIGTERISQLLSLVRNKADKMGKEYSVDQIINSLVKLNQVQILIKRKQQSGWHPLSWIVNLEFGIIDDNFYRSLDQ